jgi:outer membrane biogenesis lipoprotein LolB
MTVTVLLLVLILVLLNLPSGIARHKKKQQLESESDAFWQRRHDWFAARIQYYRMHFGYDEAKAKQEAAFDYADAHRDDYAKQGRKSCN